MISYDFPQRANSNVQRNRVTDFAARTLPAVPYGYWSIFSLISAGADSDSEFAGPRRWLGHDPTGTETRRDCLRRDTHRRSSEGRRPPALDDDDTRTTTDARAVPWKTQQADQESSTLLAFFVPNLASCASPVRAQDMPRSWGVV